MALKRTPTNKEPAKSWRPLLKPGEKSMLCAYCHGEVGARMEEFLPKLDLTRPAKYADDRDFMVNIMERWMKEANVELTDVLVKPLACLSCHDQDPRR